MGINTTKWVAPIVIFERISIMKLFEEEENSLKNWLPQDGTVYYFGKLLTAIDADFYLQHLLATIAWKNDESIIFGKKIITKRKVAWYGDQPFEYTYSKTTKKALPWTTELICLKKIIESTTNETYNSCLLNLYHDGNEGMSSHSDAEKVLKKNGTITSLSLGAERKFAFKHKQSQIKIDLLLEHGSLLVMKDETQTHWLHQLATAKKITARRVNVTFRTVV